MNPSGKYNLNFIDWNNEYESVLMRDPHSYESPIYGMSDDTFQKIMDEEFARDEDVKKTQSVLEKLNTKLVKSNKNNMCAICIKEYRKGE